MYKYKPILSDEEMSKIELPQAEFIHNSAIKVLEEIKEAINNLHKKADKLFFCMLNIVTALMVLYFLIKDQLNKKMILFFIIYISILIGVYLPTIYFVNQNCLLLKSYSL